MAYFPSLSADFISLRKPHGPPCRIVVNRDSFRELRFGAVWEIWENPTMQSKRDGLVPVADTLADLNGPVAAIRDTSLQALHHFTRFDQVNQLVSASEAAPALGFMARTMALCSLPRTNPGDRKEYKRGNGPY